MKLLLATPATRALPDDCAVPCGKTEWIVIQKSAGTMDVKTLATQWQRQLAGFGKQALLKVSNAIELLKDPSPEELQALAEAAAKPSAKEIPSTSSNFVTFSTSILVLTLVVGLVVASLTLLSQRKPSAEATASATTKSGATSAARPVESYALPLPPSALPPPPSAPLGATMMMEPTKKAVGTRESNEPKSEDFEIVPKPKWHEQPFR